MTKSQFALYEQNRFYNTNAAYFFAVSDENETRRRGRDAGLRRTPGVRKANAGITMQISRSQTRSPELRTEPYCK